MELMLVKSPYGLHPENPDTEQFIQGLRIGALLQAKFSKVRNPTFHRKFMALVKLAFDLWETMEPELTAVVVDGETVVPERNFNEFRYWLTIKAGFYHVLVYPDGAVRVRAKSIKFASMDDAEFEQLYSKVLDVVLTQVLKDQYSKAWMDNNVNRILHFA